MSARDIEREQVFLNGIIKSRRETGEKVISYVLKPVYVEEPKWVNKGNSLLKDIFNLI